MDKTELSVANCDREPIHIPGSIQPFGCLLATDFKVGDVSHISANAKEFFGLDAASCLGRPIEDLLDHEICHTLRNLAGRTTIETHRQIIGPFRLEAAQSNREHCLAIHRSGGRMIIEVEAVAPATSNLTTLASINDAVLQRAAPGLSEAAADFDHALPVSQPAAGPLDLAELLDRAVRALRRQSGIDRVMAYRFLANDEGEVIAEAKADHLEAYLGLRYPASDIPKPAREIFFKVPVRYIANVAAKAVPILALDPDEAPLDLSLADLRSTSPIHLEYLTNMGVCATITVPILCHNRLWGLFAFHHYDLGTHDLPARSALAISGKIFALEIQNHLDREIAGVRARFMSAQGALMEKSTNPAAFVALLTQDAAIWSKLVNADGMVLQYGDDLRSAGSTPPLAAIPKLFELLDPDNEMDVVHHHALPQLDPTHSWGKTAGVLIINLDSAQAIRLVFCRDQAVQKLRWAGAPAKSFTTGPFGPRLNPRASFAEYVEEIGDQAEAWTLDELARAKELRASLLAFVLGLQWNAERQQLMARELNHRVKNTLALFRSLSMQTRHSTSTVQAYAQAIEERIMALANAHDKASQSGFGGVELAALLDSELKPYQSRQNTILTGPKIHLVASSAPTLALVVHEMATNAAKYGALSVPSGRVVVQWQVSGDGLSLVWRETGGPAVVPPENSGFGLQMIENALAFEHAGETSLKFAKTGLVVTINLPNDVLRSMPPAGDGDAGSKAAPAVDAAAPMLAMNRGLVVEDSFGIALDTQMMLRSLGCAHVDLAPSNAVALGLLSRHDYDVALLDINLGHETSVATAQALRAKATPFLFASGYGKEIDLPAEFADVPRITKPILLPELEQILRRLAIGTTSGDQSP